MVNTGDGKGKTTAALGTAVRACGSGLKVLVVQFIKGGMHYGELDSVKQLPNMEIKQLGEGFTWVTKDPKRDKEVATRGWEWTKEQVLSGKFDLVILDEINYAIDYDYVNLADVVDFLKSKKPQGVHMILTGRNAKPEIIELADLVTEMRKIKHPFDKGIVAQKGIEF